MTRFKFTTDTPMAICPMPGCEKPSTSLIRLKSTGQIIGCAACVLEAAACVDAGARRCGTCEFPEYIEAGGRFTGAWECEEVACRGKAPSMFKERVNCPFWRAK